ncbi:MAG: hypothetical protein K0R29_2487 [Pseudobdellovibrio sp.]|jgi:hypothetical protein|nr:hypothetical protein [Pseudobdellovibrio sp.]
MKSIFGVLIFLSQFAFADSASQRIELNAALMSAPAGTRDYRFKLYDKQKKKFITDSDLVVTHTKKIHLLMYDEALKEFFHLHPVYKDQVWSAPVTTKVNGKYFVWAQGELEEGEDFSSLARFEVVNGTPANPKLPLSDIRKGSDSGTVLELSNAKLKVNQMATLHFKVTREDGKPAAMKPYLGAFAHVIATPTSGDELLHVHPMAGSKPNEGMLHASFTKAGEQRLWIQFIEHDQLKTIPVSVIVY